MSARAVFVSAAALAQADAEWTALCVRAAPNPFAEPGFLLPLLAYERPRGLAFALARDGGGRLIGFAALILPPLGLARLWMSAYAALPAYALDREAAAPAIEAMVRLIAERTRLAGVVWPRVERGDTAAAALSEVADANGLPLEIVATTRRTALRLNGVAAFEASLNPKRRTKWARQARKLGQLTMASGAEAVEAFFEVERKGWKGARGTALADDPARLVFARAALDGFDRVGRLDALALRLNGAPIAAGLVLKAGDRAFYWKTAYDEAHSEASPGVQLTLVHSRRLAEAPGLALVDSCAAEDHPMIGRVWSDALAFEDRALGLRPGGAKPLRIWLAIRRARMHGREALKRLVGGALGRRR